MAKSAGKTQKKGSWVPRSEFVVPSFVNAFDPRVLVKPADPYALGQIGAPSQAELDAQTLQDDAESQVPSELTQDSLSDISDEGYKEFVHQENSTKFGASLSPVLVNPYLRCLALLNALSWAVTIAFCLYLLFALIQAWAEHSEVRRRHELDLPCMFDWAEWGDCSQTCRIGEEHPVQQRSIDPTTIVHARGSYAAKAPCPRDLEGMVDTRPCNVHRCPQNLSSFDFSEHCVLNFDNELVQVRDLDIFDMETVIIDTPELYRPCENTTPPSYNISE